MKIHQFSISNTQQGIMLLEALLGVLVFSIGIIAMLGMQASALSTVNESKQRGNAAFLANRLVSNMWNEMACATASPPPSTSVCAPVTTDTHGYANTGTGTLPSTPNKLASWFTELQETLPGVAGSSTGTFASAATAPTITITPCVAGTVTANCPTAPATVNSGTTYAQMVDVTVRWKLPKSTSTRAHRTITYLMVNP